MQGASNSTYQKSGGLIPVVKRTSGPRRQIPRVTGPARRTYALICGAALLFLFVGSLLVGLGNAIEASAAKALPSPAASDSGEAREYGVPVNGAPAAEAEAAGEEARNRYYVLPMNDEMQDAVYRLCDKYDVPPELVFGIISADAMTATPYDAPSGSAMDIPDGSAAWCAAQLGISGEPSYEENLECGIFLLKEYCHKYADAVTVAMCYELGESEALERISRGQNSTAYARLVEREARTLTARPPKGGAEEPPKNG